MQYLVLIYGVEAKMPPPPKDPAEFAAYMEPWNVYTKSLQDAGVMLGANALEPTATATTVKAGKSGPVFTDGPFAETREQLGGYYLLECKDLDEALRQMLSVGQGRRRV